MNNQPFLIDRVVDFRSGSYEGFETKTIALERHRAGLLLPGFYCQLPVSFLRICVIASTANFHGWGVGGPGFLS